MALEPAAAAAATKEEGDDETLFEDIAREMARFSFRECSEVEAEEGRRHGQEEEEGTEEPADGLLPLPAVLERPTFQEQRHGQEEESAEEPADGLLRLPAVLDRPSFQQQRYLYGPPPPQPPMLPPRMLPPPLMGMSGDRKMLDGWRFVVDRLGGGHAAPALQSFRGGGSVPPRAAWHRDPLPGDAAWTDRAAASTQMVEACVRYLASNEQQVLDTLFRGLPEARGACAELIVRHAVPLIESSHGTRLLGLVLRSCADGLQDMIVARITRDSKRFFKICAARSDEVVGMIRSCRSERSLQLVRNAITPWMAPSIWERLVTLDSSRLKVVQAFVQCAPDPYFAEFIFDAIATSCLALVIHPHGLSLLQSCLEHVEWTAKDNVLSKIAWCSNDLAQHRFGNYIVQDVLKQRDPSHLAIIASCFRHNYVRLSRQRYSSNVVETCLEVFDDKERFAIVDELVWFPRFRDLVTDEFANYVISRALTVCKAPLRHRLATAILSLPHVNRRHPHCLRMFNTLSLLGYSD